ncbi:hypothetical protein [Gordonia sp. CPCC 205333]|uniref:hypothetical protein n=1 Tax=Gordonia sp. CPCC 205333 TaxID=3140790 RepID=UPI003AF3A635
MRAAGFLKSAAIAGATVAVLGVVVGCGGGDEKPSTAGAKYNFSQACDVAFGSAAKLATPLSAYVYDQPMSEPIQSSSNPLQYIDPADPKQVELKAMAQDIDAQVEPLSAAVKAKDVTTINRLRTELKKPYDGIIALCKDSGSKSTETVGGLRKLLDQQPVSSSGVPTTTTPTSSAPPSSSAAPKPVVITKAGTRVKFGQPVTLELTKNGQKTAFTFRVTSVDKATAADLKLLSADTLKNVKQLVYVRAEAKTVKQDESYVAGKPSLSDLEPSFDIATSDGSQYGPMILFGTFKPCDDGPALQADSRTYCAPFGLVADSATVPVVGLTGVQSGKSDRDKPLYIWTR